MWKRLYQRLISNERLELVRPSEEKIDAALKRVEGELGIRLPADAYYGSFAFGSVK